MSWKTSVKDILGATLDEVTYDMDIRTKEYKEMVDFFNYEYNHIITFTEKMYMHEKEAIKYALEIYELISTGKNTIYDYNWEYIKTTEYYNKIFKNQNKNKPFKVLKPVKL